jgi:hypothetical protein
VLKACCVIGSSRYCVAFSILSWPNLREVGQRTVQRGNMSRKEKKAAYFTKLMDLFQENSKLFIVGLDMVGSKQIQNVRLSLRGKGEVLMGKNVSCGFAFV